MCLWIGPSQSLQSITIIESEKMEHREGANLALFFFAAHNLQKSPSMARSGSSHCSVLQNTSYVSKLEYRSPTNAGPIADV
jgi:hypothetical protein